MNFCILDGKYFTSTEKGTIVNMYENKYFGNTSDILLKILSTFY